MLDVASCEPLEQIPTIKLILPRYQLSWGHLSISGLSQLLLPWCWPKIKGRFLEPSLTDANRYGDIWAVNICPCDISPYQEYLSYYWLNFDQTLKVLDSKKNFYFLFLELDDFTQSLYTQSLLDLKQILDSKSFWTQCFFSD